MSIHQWPEGERPREKLLARGCGALSDAELIAVLLGSGVVGKDAIALARELLVVSGGLAACSPIRATPCACAVSAQPSVPA